MGHSHTLTSLRNFKSNEWDRFLLGFQAVTEECKSRGIELWSGLTDNDMKPLDFPVVREDVVSFVETGPGAKEALFVYQQWPRHRGLPFYRDAVKTNRCPYDVAVLAVLLYLNTTGIVLAQTDALPEEQDAALALAKQCFDPIHPKLKWKILSR